MYEQTTFAQNRFTSTPFGRVVMIKPGSSDFYRLNGEYITVDLSYNDRQIRF
jgi:hypothetical protein